MIPFEEMRESRFKWLFLAGGIFCLLAAFSLIALFGGKFEPADEPKEDPAEFEAPEESMISASRWVVYVTGAVIRPGVYEVSVGSRVNDALRKAGGFSADADPEAINLAAKIEDGMQITVPRKSAQSRDNPSVPQNTNAPPSSGSSKGEGKININRATADELRALPGIGPKLSQTIVDYRTENGPFAAAEDMKKVSGIGAKRFEALKDMVVVSE